MNMFDGERRYDLDASVGNIPEALASGNYERALDQVRKMLDRGDFGEGDLEQVCDDIASSGLERSEKRKLRREVRFEYKRARSGFFTRPVRTNLYTNIALAATFLAAGTALVAIGSYILTKGQGFMCNYVDIIYDAIEKI